VRNSCPTAPVAPTIATSTAMTLILLSAGMLAKQKWPQSS
jgi:hypothetical protein